MGIELDCYDWAAARFTARHVTLLAHVLNAYQRYHHTSGVQDLRLSRKRSSSVKGNPIARSDNKEKKKKWKKQNRTRMGI